MSIKIMTRVWGESKQTGGALLVLLAMADNANHEGVCWPGHEYLATKARLDVRQVRRVIKKLIHDGELSVIKENAGRGKLTVYSLLPKEDNLSAFSEKEDICSTKRGTFAPPSLLKEPSIESSAHARGKGALNDDVEKIFAIYDAYPKKVGKPAAVRSIKAALKKVEPDWLLQTTQAYAKAVNGADQTFIPNPATWFNQERYNDDPKTWKRDEKGSGRSSVNASNSNASSASDY
jgi:hypothetical protein